jgi:LysM repeat protein
MARRFFQGMIVAVILIASFGSVGSASAWSGCGGYITVQWGDTLSGIAQQCGTTIHAIRAANPGMGWWVYAGQVLYLPSGYSYDPGYYPPPAPSGGTYVVQRGDTLGNIAGRIGVSWRDILALNPQIQNPSLIYVGQVLYLPGGVANPPPYHPVPPSGPCNCPPSSGDGLTTLKINYKFGLYVRSEPGGAIIASGLDDTVWIYNPGSVFRDHKGCVWVEVNLYKHPKGYTRGWMLVKDQLGQYFTSPQID